MRAQFVIPVLASILILGTLGLSQNAFAFTQGVCGQTITASVTLTADILNCSNGIFIGANNITLNCADHLLTGDGTGDGISLFGRTGVTIENCDVKNFALGIFLFGSSGNTLTGNTPSNNVDGIRLTNSNGNTLEGNTADSNTGSGIFLSNSNGNTLEGNTASNNFKGIELLNSSDNNTLTGNTADSNTNTGIFLANTSNSNQIYNNNFINNPTQAFVSSDSTGNVFNLAKPTGGNFWDNFDEPSEGCINTSPADNFCDGPFIFIDGQDNLPWTRQDGWLVQPVDIDIKPASDPNSINPKSGGTVPVAILGSNTFDVTDVDVTTLAFGTSGATSKHDLTDPVVYALHLEDVNSDGFTDLVSHYKQKDTGLASGDTEACITGATTGGTAIEGCDSVRVK